MSRREALCHVCTNPRGLTVRVSGLADRAAWRVQATAPAVVNPVDRS